MTFMKVSFEHRYELSSSPIDLKLFAKYLEESEFPFSAQFYIFIKSLTRLIHSFESAQGSFEGYVP
jgi:hypothetical protein